MRGLVLVFTFIALTLPGLATAQDDDQGRIVRFLESQLSDGARTVTIRGFRGALSSTAQMDLLTIADGQGVWLTLENARLTWSRLALLRGALQIDALTADRLSIARAPDTSAGPDLPDAEARPFALPELPVSISIDQASIGRVSLGAELVGTAVDLSVDGSAQLSRGDGTANLDIRRLDGPRGVFELGASFGNTSRQLTLALLVEEDAGGLVTTLLGLPGAPALRLSVAGDGPIDDFTADIALASDGQPRLTGQVQTTRAIDTGQRRVSADLGGDITPLFLPDYRDFFGPDIGLTTELRVMEDGAVELDRLSINAAAMTLDGTLSLAPGGAPRAFDLTGRISDPDGDGPVRLPVSGQEITVGAMDLVLGYDAATGDGYTARVGITALDTGPARMDRLALEASGQIVTGEQGLSVNAPLEVRIDGLAHDDPALAQALGTSARMTAQLSWMDGAPLILGDLMTRAGDLSLSGMAALRLADNSLTLTTELMADAGDLSRFAPLSGQPLAGSLTGTLVGEADLLSGAFDMILSGTGSDLSIASGLPPQLLTGDTTLTLSALRDESGTILRNLALTGRALTMTAEGRVSRAGAILSAQARLADVGLFTDQLTGSVTTTLDVTRGPEADAPYRIMSDISSAAGITATVSGSAQPIRGTVDLAATGQLPLALANRALAPQSLSGTLGFDLALRGAPTLANLSGQVQTSGARVTLPVLQTALEGVFATGRIAAGRIRFDAGGALGTGGTLGANGTVTLTAPRLPAEITVTGDALRLVDPTLYAALIQRADVTITGALAGAMQVAGTIALGDTELRVPETGLGGAAPIPPITHLGETPAERRTRIAAGLGPAQADGGGSQRIGLDLTITAPGRIFLRGRGLDAELGGRLRIGGTTANMIPAGRFDLIRGRLSILGTRLDLSDGSATLQGSFDPFIRLIATARSGGYTIGVNMIGPVSAPQISFTSSPALPEDEVLAQLLFGRSVSALSPVQLLQMADAAAALAGGSSQSGLFASLRENLGLDDLDFQTDADGNAALRAGRYLSDNVYTDLVIDQTGNTGASLNIDLTPNVTARGTFSTDGSSRLGVFFERDY